MYQDTPAGPPLIPSLLHRITWRRYRVLILSAVALTLLSGVWISGRIAFDVSGFCASSGIATANTTGHDEAQPVSGQNDSTSEWGDQKPPVNPGLLSPKIWQIVLPKNNIANDVIIHHEQLKDTATWLSMNPDYLYMLIGQNGADHFVQTHFKDKPEIIELFNNISNVGMKSDLLRYLILHVEGGIYTDTDTIALKPINKWVPADLKDKVRLIVGIEFDRRDGGAWADIPHWLQFCQWTIAAAPGHPVFKKMVNRIIESTNDLSLAHGVPLDKVKPSSFEVMNSTGPAAWTDVVFEQLQEYDPSLNTTKDLSFMTGPKLYGDILVLNINGFGMGQPHSHSINDGTIPDLALVKHLFRGSWRGD